MGLANALTVLATLAPAVLMLWFIFKVGTWYERAKMRREGQQPKSITERQAEFIENLCDELGHDPPAALDVMSRADASTLIDWLKQEQAERRPRLGQVK